MVVPTRLAMMTRERELRGAVGGADTAGDDTGGFRLRSVRRPPLRRCVSMAQRH
jgi:hypothetical protein